MKELQTQAQLGGETQQNHKGGAAINVKVKIIGLKQAVAEGDIEKKRKAEEELREAFKNLGLDDELTKYLIAHFKRAAQTEKAYEEQCKLMQEVRETIRELARKVC